jgi:hypothetical protein
MPLGEAAIKANHIGIAESIRIALALQGELAERRCCLDTSTDSTSSVPTKVAAQAGAAAVVPTATAIAARPAWAKDFGIMILG